MILVRMRWLYLWGSLWLLTIGLAPVLPGPHFLPPSWQALWSFLPDWLDWMWPLIFSVSGVALAVGSRYPRVLILGFIVGAVGFTIWGCMSIYVWLTNAGGSIPGSAVYFLVAGTKIMLAQAVRRDRSIAASVSSIEESSDPRLLDRVTQ